MRVRYHELARQDIHHILEYYEDQAGRQVAAEFFLEFRRSIKRIASHPGSFPEIRDGIQRCLLNQFPFQINFEMVDQREIKILVVKHHRRDPDLGLDR